VSSVGERLPVAGSEVLEHEVSRRGPKGGGIALAFGCKSDRVFTLRSLSAVVSILEGPLSLGRAQKAT